MGLRSYLNGEKFSVYLWEENNECPALVYLKSLKASGKPQLQDAATLERRLRELSDYGPPTLEQHGHILQNSDGIYELKATNGARLFWFYEKDRVVICSHGAQKPKSYNAHIKRAQAVRSALQAQAQAPTETSIQKPLSVQRKPRR